MNVPGIRARARGGGAARALAEASAPELRDLPGEYFERRWQAVAERSAQVFRWAFIVLLGLLNNLGYLASPAGRPLVNVLVGVWAVISVLVTAVLWAGYRPRRLFALSLTAVDLLLASGVIYFSNGFGSPIFLALFVTVVTAALRLGLWMGLVASVLVAVLYLMLGGLSSGPLLAIRHPAVIAVGQSAVLLVVGLVTGLMTRELFVQRRQAVRLAAEADTLRDLAADLAASVGREDLLDAVLNRAQELTGAGRAALLLPEAGTLTLLAAAPAGVQDAALPDYDLARRALAAGEPVVGAEARLMIVPVLDAETPALLLLRSEHPFEPRHLLIARALAATVAGALSASLRVQRQAKELADLKRRAESVAAQDRSRADLLSLVSHELRRPLAVLNVYSGLLAGQPAGAGGTAAQLMETVRSTLDEMDALVEQLAAVARLESGGPPPERVVVDLAEEVRAAVASVGPLAGPAHRLVVLPAAEPVRVRCAPQHLRLMLGNLLTNAIKFSPDGGAVECAVSRSPSRGIVSVRDEGIGIEQAQLSRLFKRYSRLADAGRRGIPGTGLGLYLCRELARAGGGDVKVRSEPGSGSTFSISLPLAH